MITIFGATGTIGQAVAEAGIDRGLPVTGVSRRPADHAQWQHLKGDCSLPECGLSQEDLAELQASTTDIVISVGSVDFHAPLPTLLQAHLGPLNGALTFAVGCPHLRSVTYVSSIVAVGATSERHGPSWLPAQPKMRNFYEYVKYLGETRARANGLPLRVIRPGHVLTGTERDNFGLFDVLELALQGRRVIANEDATYWVTTPTMTADVIVDGIGRCDLLDAFSVDAASPKVGAILDMVAARHLPVRRLPTSRALTWAAQAAPLRALRRPLEAAVAPYIDAQWLLDLPKQPCQGTERGATHCADYVRAAIDAWFERKASLR